MDVTPEATRKAARWRPSLLPAMGFALLGYPVLAALGLAFLAIFLGAVAVVSFRPEHVAAWVALASLLGGLICWVVEYLAVGRIVIQPPGESSPISRRFKRICALSYIGSTAVCIWFLLNFGSFVMRGDGMNPIILPGERILYHRQVLETDLAPGQLAAFRVSPMSSWGQPGDIVIGRILAAPGDEIWHPRNALPGERQGERGDQRGRRLPGRPGHPQNPRTHIRAARLFLRSPGAALGRTR